MVVTDSILIARCRPGRLDSPKQANVGQDADGVVHRTPRNDANVGPDDLDNIFRREMRSARHSPQDGQALRGDLESLLP
jgi:hypothetical protein